MIEDTLGIKENEQVSCCVSERSEDPAFGAGDPARGAEDLASGARYPASGTADPRLMNPIALAFLGDALYERYVRERLIRSGSCSGRADLMHRQAVVFVRASAQAEVVRTLMPELTEEEQRLVLRARNHKIATKPKNADAVSYKWATAFEALLGYLELSGEEERLGYIMDRAWELSEKREY